MKISGIGIIKQDKVFVWLAAVTGLILLVPLIAMRFTDEVNWSLSDFIIMGILLFGIGSLFIFTARRLPRKQWTLTGLVLFLALIWIWAELAVGVFTSIGR